MQKQKHTICLAEDHIILRDGLKHLLSSHPEFDIIAEASDGIELLNCIVKDNPDIVIMDLTMPKMNGLDAIKEIKKRRPLIKLLVLTAHAFEEYVESALRSGADGYILKDSGQNELVSAVETILQGNSYLSPKISQKLMNVFFAKEKTEQKGDPNANLTTREIELLRLIAEGYRNKEIAEFLHISIKTVEKHRSNMMKKLDIHNTAMLTTYAIEKGFVSCPAPFAASA